MVYRPGYIGARMMTLFIHRLLRIDSGAYFSIGGNEIAPVVAIDQHRLRTEIHPLPGMGRDLPANIAADFPPGGILCGGSARYAVLELPSQVIALAFELQGSSLGQDVFTIPAIAKLIALTDPGEILSVSEILIIIVVNVIDHPVGVVLGKCGIATLQVMANTI